jgi:exopolysaccharide/PEP-CTERM locus tyrosine autokinase
MSLVEQTIARLKKEQMKTGQPAPISMKPNDRSPHQAAPVLGNESLEDTTNLSKRIAVDNAALRVSGYFPEADRDRQFADQYRRIKNPLIEKALSASSDSPQARVIMITSALPGDGKTFTSINLTLSLALERDVSVLLIDADVAKRHISTIFKLQDQAGLLDALVDERLDPETLIVPTTTRGLSMLPAGKLVAGTAELLNSNRMRHIVETLTARYQRRLLVLDSPPLLVTSEGTALIKIAGQVVLVVRAGVTPRPAVQSAMALIDAEQAGGIVLNQVQGITGEGYYGYGEYGSYGSAGDQP